MNAPCTAPTIRATYTALALAAALALPLQAQRHDIPFTTQERFDAAAVPADEGSHPEIYSFIDAHREEHLKNLQRWLRQPSISAENRGIQQMAEMLRDDLKRLGFKEAELVPTSGHPGVWGYYDAGAPHTLAIYMMYDVQPVEPKEWKVDPFAGEIVDHDLGKVVMARGATNQKGPERAFLNALESIIAVRGKLPVNLMVAAEGEEELGSPHFPEVIARYADRLKTADGVFFPANLQDPGGSVDMMLGVKGILYFEMEAKGGEQGGPRSAEIHSSLKAMVDAPVLRLVQAIASLTSPDGNTIAVPGYYDAIRPPNEEEQRLFNGMLAQWTQQEALLRKSLGVERWIGGKTGRESLLDNLFNTTLNVDGIWGGYTGPGVKTILPHKATAKLDSRLVPNQTPDEALRLIRAHLDAKGFRDVEIRKLSGYPPAQTSIEAPIIQAAISVIRKYGVTPSVAPRIAGSAPYYLFTDTLKLPMLFGGLGHGSGAHAPNEYMVIEPKPGSKIAGLADLEKFYVDLLFRLAGQQQHAYDPTSVYKKESIQGFAVLFNPQVLAHEEAAAAVRKELDKQLGQVTRVLRPDQLAELRKVRFWVEWQKREDGAAEFHPSAEWLEENGYNPEKAGCVEISNSNHFIEWTGKQPWMVLHELAHAYHYRVLSEDHPGIEAAYQQAVNQKLYDEVDHVSGEKRPAWARNDQFEYFAELSEAFFGTNDYYPFTRAELEKHDPVGYKLLQDLWGQPVGDQARVIPH